MDICYLFHCGWMIQMFQHMWNVIFAVKNKRTPHLGNLGNFLDFILLMDSLLYIFTVYKGYRLNTFLGNPTPSDIGRVTWENYAISPINENAVLIVYGIAMWMRCFYTLKLFRPLAGIIAIGEKLFTSMITYGFFYFSVLFLFSVVGFVLFYDLEQFNTLQTTLFTLFQTTVSEYDADIMINARLGAFLGYAFFISFMIINLILIVNLIVGRLAATYKTYNKKRELLVLLNTLHVREVLEADDKYSAMVSAPFPLNMLHFFTGSLLINMKSQTANIVVLHFYYFPIAIVAFAFFAVYQMIILPFCYFKIVGHKFALMIKAPQGHGSRTTMDRFGHAILFIVLGPVFLAMNCVVDLFWFLIHLYKMDLEVSSKKMQDSDHIDINRRTYKKMLKYFA